MQPSGSQTVKPDPSNTRRFPKASRPAPSTRTRAIRSTQPTFAAAAPPRHASLHITGTVEPIPTVTLQSIFYPTDYPDKKNPQVGLVKSQQLELATTAAGFKKYLEYDPDAKLSVEAYADVRGSKPFNQDLSERRVERIKQYLVDQGVAADKVETAAYGKDRPMPKDQVAQLEGTNPQAAAQGPHEEQAASRLAGLQPPRRYHPAAVGKEVRAVLPARRRRFRHRSGRCRSRRSRRSKRRSKSQASQQKRRRENSPALFFLARIFLEISGRYS